MKGQADQGNDALTAEELSLIEGTSDPATVPDAAPDAPVHSDAGADPANSATDDSDIDQDDVTDGDVSDPKSSHKRVPRHLYYTQKMQREAAEKRAAEAERQRDDERKRVEILESRFQQLLQHVSQPQQQQPAAAPKPPPPLEEDPVGHLLGKLSQHEQLLGAVVQAVTGQTQQSEQGRAVQALSARAAAMEREFAAQTPDYQQAFEHLVSGRRRELMAAGWQDAAEIDAMMAREATQLAATAIQRGQNPAAVLYEISKARGYQPVAAPPPVLDVDAAPAPTPAQANPAAVAQVEMMARGQNQARGINRAAGQTTPPINANALANMSDDEFAAWMKKASPAEKRSVGLGA